MNNQVEKLISKWMSEIAQEEAYRKLDAVKNTASYFKSLHRQIAIALCLNDLKKLNEATESEVKVCVAPKDYVCNVNDNGICKLATSCTYQQTYTSDN